MTVDTFIIRTQILLNIILIAIYLGICIVLGHDIARMRGWIDDEYHARQRLRSMYNRVDSAHHLAKWKYQNIQYR